MTTADAALLGRLERYYDSVPRTGSRVEEVGPFTLFVAESGRPYYARPRRGPTAAITPDDVRRVLARQREIGVPQAIEWVDETTPGLPAARLEGRRARGRGPRPRQAPHGLDGSP